MSRMPIIAGNWKMHKTVTEAEKFIQGLLPRLTTTSDDVEVVICPPFTAIESMVDSTRGTRVEVYAQNMHQDDSGAFTGEVSAAMLSQIDTHGVILGHSERRAYFNESDEALAAKVAKALEAGIKPMLCVGETEAERDGGSMQQRLRTQIEGGLASVADDRLAEVSIAYEPVWAIGTGRVATPEQAQEACAFIRSLIAERDAAQADAVRILYGGSAKPDNAAELLALADCDGLLIGGASLEPESFAAMVNAA